MALFSNNINLGLQQGTASAYNSVQRQFTTMQNVEAKKLDESISHVGDQSFVRFERNINKLREQLSYVDWLCKKAEVLIRTKP